jgi:hypothetical protein
MEGSSAKQSRNDKQAARLNQVIADRVNPASGKRRKRGLTTISNIEGLITKTVFK